jgi:hypothetical protein
VKADVSSPPPSGGSGEAEPRASHGGSSNAHAIRRRIGRIIASGGLLFGANNALHQAWGEASDIINRTGQPLPLVLAFQSTIAVLGAAAAFGVWKRARWSAKMTVAWGVVTASFVALLEWLLDLGAETRGGLLVGAAVILVVAAVIARFASRDQRIAESDGYVNVLNAPVPSSEPAARDVMSDRQRN